MDDRWGSCNVVSHLTKKVYIYIYIYITTASLCNLYSYMFRHVHFIIREFTTKALLSYIRSLKLPDDETKMSKHVEV